MHAAKAIVKNRVLILIVALALMIPSVLGMLGTRINYDMLNYLPDDMDTVIGQDALKDDFGKGAFSFIIVEDMPAKDVAALKEKIEAVDHVDTRAVVRLAGRPVRAHGAAARQAVRRFQSAGTPP